jgi:hypothetical protein
MVDELDRPPGAARIPTQPGDERLVPKVVRQPGGVREQLARRGPREGIQGAPALKQLAAQLAAERRIECQPPLAGEPEGHGGGHALRDARHPERVVRTQRAALPVGQVSGRAAPDQAGAGGLDARQRTRRASRDLCLDRSLESGWHGGIPQAFSSSRELPRIFLLHLPVREAEESYPRGKRVCRDRVCPARQVLISRRHGCIEKERADANAAVAHA